MDISNYIMFILQGLRPIYRKFERDFFRFQKFGTQNGTGGRKCSNETNFGNHMLAVGLTGGVSIFSYNVWKRNELSKLEADARSLARDGYISLDMSQVVTIEEKKRVWFEIIKPHLLKHWQKVEPTLNLEPGSEQWPTPERGRSVHLTSTEYLQGLPKLFSGNYTPQAIIAFMIDPQLSLVHFGNQTDIKLRALISPLWALETILEKLGISNTKIQSFCRPNDMFELYGDDQAWHIVNIPRFVNSVKPKHETVGVPWPAGAHYDAGYASLYRSGVPPRRPHDVTPGSSAQNLHHSRSTQNLALQQRLLAMALHQLAVLFYCETPGALTPAHGATGFYPRSHLVMLEGTRKYLARKRCIAGDGEVILPWSTHLAAVRQLYEPRLQSSNSTDSKTNDAFSIHDLASASKTVLIQPTLQDGQGLLILGPLVHTTMWVHQLMDGNNPRVIVNCKIAATKQLRRGEEVVAPGDSSAGEDPNRWKQIDYSMQRDLINRISANSLLYQLYVGTLDNLYEELGQEGCESEHQYVSPQEVDALSTTYMQLCLENEPKP